MLFLGRKCLIVVTLNFLIVTSLENSTWVLCLVSAAKLFCLINPATSFTIPGNFEILKAVNNTLVSIVPKLIQEFSRSTKLSCTISYFNFVFLSQKKFSNPSGFWTKDLFIKEFCCFSLCLGSCKKFPLVAIFFSGASAVILSDIRLVFCW